MDTQDVADHLIRDGYNADSLHGDLSQQQRDKVMKRFRERSMQLLIATDVAARGIDVQDVTHVINYSLPDEIESYTHRSGRTGRAGKTGISICIVNTKELGKIRQIEKIIGKQFTKADIPTGFDVCEKQLFALVHKVQNVEVNESQIEQYIPRIMDEFEALSKEDVIKRFASLEFNRFLDYYKNAPDLNAAADDRGSDRGDSLNRPGFRADYTRLFINLGSVDNFTRGDLLSFVCNNGKISGKNVGKIDLKGVYSFFDVENEFADQLFANFKEVTFNNRTVRIEKSGEGESSRREGGGGERRSGGGERRGGGGERKSGYAGRTGSGSGGYPKREGGGSGYPRREGGGGGERSGRRDSARPDSGFKDFSGRSREERSGGSAGKREGGERRRRS